MKRLFSFFNSMFFSICILHSFPSHAQIESQSVGDEQLIQPQNLHPFKLILSSDRTGASKLTKKHNDEDFENTELKYGQANATLEATFYYDPCRVEGAIATAGYSHTLFDWNANPYFEQQNFNTLTLGIDGFSGRCNGWFWQARLAANFDLDHFNFNYYTTFDGLLWGRYSSPQCQDWGFHFGIIGQTGMHVDRVYPILGADWQYSPKLKLNLIFPLNVSAIYKFDCNWSAGVGGRFFDTRHRTGNDEPKPMAIICYRAIGAEALINYSNCDWMDANIHAGYIVTGKLKVSNKHQEHGKWFEIGYAPYIGAQADFKY